MEPVSPRACAGHVLDTVPSIMQFIRTEMRRHRGLDLSVPQFRVLTFLNRNDGRSVSEVAERIGLSLPAASRLVEGLVRRGLVDRGESSQDRRRSVLQLTARGRDLVRSARAGTEAQLASVLAGLPERDRALVAEALGRLRPFFVRSPGPTAAAVR